VSTTPQKRALNRYRKRLNQRGMARFEVLGLDADRELIRSLARRLAGEGPDSARIRTTVRLIISGEQSKKGGILSALRRSPLVGADLEDRQSLAGELTRGCTKAGRAFLGSNPEVPRAISLSPDAA
jgi:hypothetical protein